MANPERLPPVKHVFSDYTEEERANLEESIRGKKGNDLTYYERRFLRLKEEWIRIEREDDQPRYGR